MSGPVPTELNVAFWNILMDDGFFGAAPQSERCESIVSTLKELPFDPDIVGLAEAEDNSWHGHLGKKIAREVSGVDGIWTPHSRPGETLGLFGPDLQGADVIELEKNRRFLLAQHADIDIALIHFAFGKVGDRLRQRQAADVVGRFKDSPRAIIMGDFNSVSWQRSRRLVHQAGFVSVFSALGRRRPATVLTEKYHKLLRPHHKLATSRGMSPDDIYVKGVEVSDAGVFEGDSDHRGVWARIII